MVPLFREPDRDKFSYSNELTRIPLSNSSTPYTHLFISVRHIIVNDAGGVKLQ